MAANELILIASLSYSSRECTVLDLEEFLPPMEEILSAPEIGDLAKSKSFQFLLKLGYEHIYETLNKN